MQWIYCVKKNKRNHPISSNSHPSARTHFVKLLCLRLPPLLVKDRNIKVSTCLSMKMPASCVFPYHVCCYFVFYSSNLWQANVDKNQNFLIFEIHFQIFEIHFLIFEIHFLRFEIHFLIFKIHFLIFEIHFLRFEIHFLIFKIHFLIFEIHFLRFEIHFLIFKIHFLIFEIHFLRFEIHFLIFKIHFLIFEICTIFKY